METSWWDARFKGEVSGGEEEHIPKGHVWDASMERPVHSNYLIHWWDQLYELKSTMDNFLRSLKKANDNMKDAFWHLR